MAMKKTAPSWTNFNSRLADLDHAGLLRLVQDLYAASKDNQAFLRARLHLGEDVLQPFKEAIDRWLWPEVFRKQDTSVANAKKALAENKKASGTADGLAELMVFYCERASGFSCDVGLDDEAYLSALVRMFEQALKAAATLPETQRPALWTRLRMVRDRSHDIGYGVGEDMDALLTGHGADD